MSDRNGSAATSGSVPPRPLPRPPAREQARLLRRLFADPAPVLTELQQAHGPVCGLGAGPVRLAIVGSAAAARELLMMPVDRFRWNHKFNVLGFVVGDASMIVSDGDDHRRRRSSVQAAFGRRRLEGWIPMIVDRTDAAVDQLVATATDRPDDPIDLYPVGRRLALEIVTRALFGERLAARSTELVDVFRRSQDYLAAPAVRQIPHPFPMTARARVRADRRRLDELVDTEIAVRRSSPSGDQHDVLEVLVAEGSLTDREIRDQVATLIGAGFDTTAASLAWILWRATLTADVWQGLRSEADRVLGALGDRVPPGPEVLAGLVLADRVVHETLRLHPAGVVAPREAAVDLVVGGYRVRAGTLILWSPYLVGRDPDRWTDAESFDPDRFAGLADARRKELLAAWLPFGGGPRNCIGFALAQMELVLILARLAQRLDLTPTGTTVPPPTGMVVNRPAGGVPMQVTERAG